MEILQVIVNIILIIIGLFQIYMSSSKVDNSKKKKEVEINEDEVNLDENEIIKIPSDRLLVQYIINKFVKNLEEMRSPAIYLNENVYLEKGIKINFDSDADSLIKKLTIDLIDNKKFINTNNLTYIQTTNEAKIKRFLNKFNISEYPSPLIMFKNPKLLFGFIESEGMWKIFINSQEY